MNGHTKRRRVIVLIAGTAVMATGQTVQSALVAGSGEGRFDIQAQARQVAVSDDRRFALSATVRHDGQMTSLDGRYVLQAVNVPDAVCLAEGDGIFANGFESR